MRIGVAGASGYLGAELLRLLAGHPSLEVAVAQADTSAGIQVATLYPNLAPEYRDLVFSPLDPAGLHGLDAVFIALPSGRSQDLVPALARSVPLVVDLGGDFRLRDPSLYPVWYGFEHRAPELLGRFVYGLPELFRHELAGAPLVAAPGCYFTAATLALAPLVKEGLIEPTGVIQFHLYETRRAASWAHPQLPVTSPAVNRRRRNYRRAGACSATSWSRFRRR